MKKSQVKQEIIQVKQDRKKVTSKMPLTRCSCGVGILVIPDLAAMDRAVKNHLAKHKGASEQHLVEQILEAASK
jgi:hypothetical protein